MEATGFTPEVREYHSWGDLKSFLGTLGYGWIFRGQRSANWLLSSSLERKIGLLENDYGLAASGRSGRVRADAYREWMQKGENFFLSEFKKRAHHYLRTSQVPDSMIEWLALMQHHGAPTRLVDFTNSVYVAAFFAVEDAEGPCALWAIRIHNILWEFVPNLLSLSEDIFAAFPDQKNPEVSTRHEVLEKLCQPELVEKLLSKFSEKRIPAVVPLMPARWNERLTIQQGLFLCPGDIGCKFEENFPNLSADFVAAMVKNSYTHVG